MLGEKEPLVRTQPDGPQVVTGGRGVGRDWEVDAEHAVDRGQRFRVAGIQTQVDVGEEGALEETVVVEESGLTTGWRREASGALSS